MMLGADHLGPRFHTITLRDSHPATLLRERRAHYGIKSFTSSSEQAAADDISELTGRPVSARWLRSES
jgi:hypothetical protein